MLSEMASAIRKYFDVRVEKDLVFITTIVTKFPITPNTRHVGNKNMLMKYIASYTLMNTDISSFAMHVYYASKY
jgi:hypothetical protein